MDVLSYILAKKYVDEAISDVARIRYLIVDELPDVGEPGIIYLVRMAADVYVEYVWQDGRFIKLKDTVVASILTEGYYFAGVFWKEASHINRLPDYVQSVYIDLPTKELYYYNSNTHAYGKFMQQATESEPGIMKLYAGYGINADGTITQKFLTGELNKKVELDTSKLASDECLGLKLDIA